MKVFGFEVSVECGDNMKDWRGPARYREGDWVKYYYNGFLGYKSGINY